MKNDSTELVFFVEQKSFFQRKRALIKLLMRISAINIFILSLSAGAFAYSIDGKGQSIENTTVELEFVNAPLKSVFAAIEQQTEFSFVVPLNEVDVKHRVSLEAGTYTVKDALDLVLKGTSIGFEQTGDYVILFPKIEGNEETDDKRSGKEVGKSEKDVSVALITGTVKNASTNEPMAGVNIVVKGTLKGTTTDVEGKFGIEAEDKDVLVFSFIGFKSFETQVSARAVIDVTMEEDVNALQEVVVNAGYWQVEDKMRTGNISKITAKEIANQPVTSPLMAMQGRVPGVYIQQNTGVPGGGLNVQIRGVNSIAGGNDPLYIVNGIPFTSTSLTLRGDQIVRNASPLSILNPSNIESIEVLKDADATAIYGSRGANGVVLITTKRGYYGDAKIDVSFQQGVGEVTRMLDLLNTDEYLEMRNEAFSNDGTAPNATSFDVNGVWAVDRYTDWQTELIGGTARTTNSQVSLSGGTSNIQYMVGGGYYRETTVFPGDNAYHKGSASLNLTYVSINQKFRASFSTNYGIEKSNLFNQDLTQLIVLPPNAPALYDETGNLNWENGTWINPLSILRKKYETRSDNLIGNAVLTYEFMPGLQIKTNIGYNRIQRDEVETNPLSSYSPFISAFTPQTISSYFANSSVSTSIVEPQVSWDKRIGSGELKFLLGSTLQYNTAQGRTLQATGFNSDELVEDITSASSVRVNNASFNHYRYLALFGRINYSWKQKYIVNLTLRRDGSSRFGPDKRLASFGAAGVAWLFSNEEFVREALPFISFGKFRASYGTTGNDQIGDYQYLELWRSDSNPYQGTIGLYPTRIGNPDYAWEVNRKLEVALECGVADDRILLSGSYYQNRSSNQLVRNALPPSTGFTSIQDNLSATVQNTGFEIELSTVNVRRHDLTWSTAINLTIPRNKLLEFPDLENSTYSSRYEVGKPLTILKRHHSIGVEPLTGVYVHEDVDGDDIVSFPNDYKAVKKIDRDYYGGVKNTVNYRGFQLDFLFQFVNQTGINYMSVFNAPGYGLKNQPTIVLDRWQKSGDRTNVQRYTAIVSDAYNAYNLPADRHISDASFIRLKNVSLSYAIPKGWIDNLGIQQIKVDLQGQNLLTFTDFIGMDPESQNLISLPPLRILTAGVHLTF